MTSRQGAECRAEEYLLQLECIRIKIRQRQQQLEELREKSEGPGAICYDRVLVQTSGENQVENRMIDYLAKSERVYRILAYYEQQRDRIITQIQELEEPKHVDVLYKRYVEGKGRAAAAKEMNYSERQIDRITGKALRAFYYQHLLVSPDVFFS